jgi:hypothetical protein
LAVSGSRPVRVFAASSLAVLALPSPVIVIVAGLMTASVCVVWFSSSGSPAPFERLPATLTSALLARLVKTVLLVSKAKLALSLSLCVS